MFRMALGWYCSGSVVVPFCLADDCVLTWGGSSKFFGHLAGSVVVLCGLG